MVNGEDAKIKAEREALSTLNNEVTRELRYQNRLDRQYERVIRELRKINEWWLKNAWKATFISLYFRLKKVVKK